MAKQYNKIGEEHSSEGEKKEQKDFWDKVIQRQKAKTNPAYKFYEIFKVPLQRYWIDNIQGLDRFAFDEDIVKSNERDMTETILERWGKEALDIILELVGGD